MAQDRGTTHTSQLISGLVPKYTHMLLYPLETHLFPLTKPSQFRNNIQTNTVHNIWPILQILDRAPTVCQDLDTVLI
ncbi:hypothetical protein TNCV_2155691 [Trichonephila clavipes]|nr:hypothetical protein TNCV_2155691 [Trichonephila clavipes]